MREHGRVAPSGPTLGSEVRMPLVLGVDASTQSTKIEVRDADSGAVVARGAAPHPATSSPRSEQDPAAWWRALAAAIGQAGVTVVDALSIAGQQHGMVVLDERGTVLRPAKLWNDTESAPQAAALVARHGAAAFAEATGSVPLAAFTITKLAWLAAAEPEVFQQVRAVLLPHDWLTSRLTHRYVTDRGDASGTGYWSPFEQRWRPDLLQLVDPSVGADGWAARLPAVLGPTEPAGSLADDAARDLGLRAGCLVAAGTGDNMAGALGVALGPGDVALSLGTSGTAYATSETPTADATGAVAGFADATGRYLPLVCTLNATQVTDAMARLLGVTIQELDALAGQAGAARERGRGVVLVPYLNGERTPNRPDATGTLTGLRLDTTREHLALAAYEGVICGLLDGVDALHAAGLPRAEGRLVLVGGGARSPRYRQVLADLSGRAVTVPDASEQVAAGACVQAAATLSGADPIDVARSWGLDRGAVVDPDPASGTDLAVEVRARYALARG